MEMIKLAGWVCIAMLILLSAGSGKGLAQTTTATLSGIVTDESGAVLPGAHVVVANTETGVQRSISTNEKGYYLVSELAPGRYQVTVSQSGFETLVRAGITLAVGQSVSLPLAMKVGAVTEQVTVTGEAPAVNTTSSAVAGVVDEKRIEDMPLNGRDFSQLPLVQPGAVAIRNGQSGVSAGFGTRISMGGSRPDQTGWLLDGTSIRSIASFGTPGSAAGVMLGVDAVREFQVLTSDYSAELGGTSGGVVNMVSKSGTNGLHGSLYEFLRNSDLDARNFFDVKKPAFKRNQFGASIGGPIKKDSTFFFGNYEGLRQRQGVTKVSTVPDANVHQGLLAGQPVQIAPEIAPYLALWPLPNGPTLGGGLATLFLAASNPVTEDYFVVRVDHHINDKQSIFTRFTLDQGVMTSPDAVPITTTQAAVHSRYATLQHDYVVSPNFLITTLVDYNRSLLSPSEINLINYPPALNLFNGDLPQLSFPGATQMGPSGNNVGGRVQNLYEYHENLQYIRGSHTMKFGAQVTHVGSNRIGGASALFGSFTWPSLQGFLTDSKLSAFADVALGSSSARSLVQYIYGFYFQDDWKMTSRFTWNLGLRYEPWTAPTEKYGRISSVRDWQTATAFDPSLGLFKSPGKKDFSPRVGFAWDPKGDGKTAVRAGFGIFFMDVVGDSFLTASAKNPPAFGSTSSVLGNLASAPSDMAAINSSLLSPVMVPFNAPEFVQYNLNSSYEMKFNFSVERQLPGNFTLSVGYLGDRGVHLWRDDDANDIPPIIVNGRSFVVAGTPPPNLNMGVGTIRYSDAQSFYNALQIEIKKRFSHGFQVQSSYTWSKNIDDSTTGIGGADYGSVQGFTSQPYNPKSDRGLSNLNLVQTLVLNGIYAFPSPAQSGFTSTVLGGWQLASIFTANSGAPFSAYLASPVAPDRASTPQAQHPDLIAGRSFSSLMTGNPNHYIDLTAFVLPPAAPAGFPAKSGFYGNAARDILSGPALVNLDFSLQKSTALKFREGSRLEFRADLFNLFNHRNFGIPGAAASQVLNPATGANVPGAGKITTTVATSRQMQFSLKLVF